MKKILLCTTALFGLAAGSAFATDDMKVSFTGSSKFEAGTKRQDKDHKAPLSFSPNQKSSSFYTNQKASLKVEGKADSLTYGAVLRLQMIGNGSDGMSDARNSRSHIYLDTDAGSVHLGSNFAASKLMQIDASTIASATGGIDGDWTNFANTTLRSKTTITNIDTGATKAANANKAASFVVTGVDTLSNTLDTGESARKITYMSPRISGLQVGLSFAPDLNNTGTSKTLNTADSTKALYMGLPVRVKNLWSMGLNYTNSFNDVNVAFAAVADRGTAVRQDLTAVTAYNGKALTANEKFRNLKTYSLGAVVGTNGFSAAVSYHNDGQSLTLASQDRFKSSWFTAGLAYENGPMSTSLTYLNGKKGSKNDSNNTVKTQIVSLGADYEVAPGLTPFAEVSMINVKPKSKDLDDKNKATVFMIGTKLKF